MATFESSRGRKSKRDSKDSYSKRNTRGRSSSFRDSSKGRGDSRRNRSNFEMTKVICSSCGVECEVPFKPTSTKPVYCSDCFTKKGKVSSNKIPSKDLDIINEKLNRIMKALDIE